jgi:hypothetical protein
MKIESAQAESILAEMTALIDVLGSALERCHTLSADAADPSMAPHYLAQIKRTAAAALAQRQRAEDDCRVEIAGMAPKLVAED